jgi:hypothetical protein
MKSNHNHYVTLSDGIDFRQIAKIMSEAGHQMNHATARNVLIIALRSLLTNLASQFNIKITEDRMQEMLRSQQLHDALSHVLIEAHKESKKGKAI